MKWVRQAQRDAMLDFTMVNAGGEMLQWVQISCVCHGELFADLDPSRFPQLGRLNDYFTDVLYEVGDLGQLRVDLKKRRSEVEGLENVQANLIDQMIELVELAQAQSMRVDVIAD